MDNNGQDAPPDYTQANQQPLQGHLCQPQYPQPTTTVVVVNQPRRGEGPQDYTFKNGRLPGAILISVAVADLITYLVMGFISSYGWAWSDALSGFIFYLIPGILGVVGAKKQHSSGVAIACIVMSSIALCVVFAQLGSKAILFTFDVDEKGFGIAHILIFCLALAAFGCLVSLIAYASKVVCCRPPSGGMINGQNRVTQFIVPPQRQLQYQRLH